MFYNYLKVAFRNIFRRKVYALINILGLTVGLTACLIIFVFVTHEFSYDTFHAKSSSTYRVVREATIGDQHSALARINYAYAELAVENIAAVQNVTQVGQLRGLISLPDLSKEFDERKMLLADPAFFEVFDVNFLQGNPEAALSGPSKVVLTSSAARKYFGDEDAIGKILRHNRARTFEVTGVVEDWPENSHMSWDMLFSIESTRNWYSEQMFKHWGNVWVFTYVVTDQAIDQAGLDSELNRVAYEHGPEALADLNVRFYSQRLENIHLDSNLDGELQTNGSRLYVVIFSAVGVLILLIACFNFINLATARASWRAKEVGLRKVVGASKKSLVVQFLGESFLVTTISFLLSLLLCTALLPIFGEYIGKSLSFLELASVTSIMGMLAVLIIVGVLAGSFPAFLLSSFRPIQVLKGNTNVGSSALANNLRRTLVIVQFTISIGLVIASLTIYNQLQYAQNKALGYDKENVVIVDLYNQQLRESRELLKSSLLEVSDVVGVSAMSDTPPSVLNSWWMDGKGEMSALHELMPVLAVDFDFVGTMKLDVIDGRDFDASIVGDEETAILMNEAAVAYLDLENPVGVPFALGPDNKPNAKVIGVVKDFHMSSLHDKINPMVMFIWPSWLDRVAVRIVGGDYERSLAAIEDAWTAVNPDWALRFHFLDDDFDRAYVAEQRLNQLIFTFSGLALIIGMLGLFGLANYVAEQKTKEIGIRKVLGATISHVLWIQYRSFLALLSVAFLIGTPIAVFFLNEWLSQFAYRVQIQWYLVLLGGVLTLVVAMSTVGIQSVKAAMQNPVDSLRTE